MRRFQSQRAVQQRRGSRTATAGASLLRLWLASLVLIAFSFQSYVTQTHIHLVAQTSDPAKADSGKAQRDRYPANQDPSNCPICQEVLHSGSFITPSAIAVLLPSLAVSVLAIVIDTTIVSQPVSHSWRGRAPPRH
jgi:hypothetical protein